MPSLPRSVPPDEPVVLILGAGLTGLSVLTELARGGVSSLAVDPHGVGWGSSGRTSRLMDPEWGRAPWVPSSQLTLRWLDRDELVRAARHVVRPTPVALPLGRGESSPRRRRARLSYGVHRLSAREGEWPAPITIDVDQRALLLPGFRFGDEEQTRSVYGAVVEDQRLTELRALEARQAGGWLWARTELVSLEAAPKAGLARAMIRDRIDGAMTELEVRAIIDATGAWSSRTLDALGIPSQPGTALPHLVGAALPHRVDAALRAYHARDGSTLRVVPAVGGLVVSALVTARPFSPTEPGPTRDEIDYLDEFLNDGFPSLATTPRLYWATPCAAESVARPTPVSERRSAAGVPLFSVASLGLELHAHAARLVRARLSHELGHENLSATPAKGHLPGGDIASVAGCEAAARAAGLDALQARWLVLRYGSQWESLLELEGGTHALGSDGIPLACEIPWLYGHERMRTLSDLLRSWRLPEIVASATDERRIAGEALSRLAQFAGWSAAREERELKRWWRERALHFFSREDAS